MLFWIAFLLVIRSALIGIFENRRLFHGMNALALGVIALLLLPIRKFDPFTILAAASVIGISLTLRFFGFFKKNSLIFWIKSTLFGAFFVMAALSVTVRGISHLIEDKAALEVELTGRHVKKWVEWKNPMADYQTAWLDAYEVILRHPKGEILARHYIYGDFVAVRSEVIRFSPLLSFLGIQGGCRIEAVYNGYNNMKRHTLLPHLGYPILDTSPLFSLVWNWLFYGKVKLPGVKSGTLESNSLPLIDQKGAPIIGKYILYFDRSVILASH